MDQLAEHHSADRLHLSQAVHAEAVHRRLRGKKGEVVSLAYGPRLVATGTLLVLEEGFACVQPREGWQQWVPLLQITGVDGQRIPTARFLASWSSAGDAARMLTHALVPSAPSTLMHP